MGKTRKFCQGVFHLGAPIIAGMPGANALCGFRIPHFFELPHLGDGRRMNGAVRGRVESEKCWFEKTAKKFLTGGEKWL
jgi:hypothetical protein